MTRRPDPFLDDRAPPLWLGLVLLWLMLLLALLVAWLLSAADWASVMDFVAPTAAQARDMGLARIVEGL